MNVKQNIKTKVVQEIIVSLEMYIRRVQINEGIAELINIISLHSGHQVKYIAITMFHTRECVVLKDNLMNDSTARLPEPHTILGSRGCQEVVHLLVDILGPGKVLLSFNLCLDQVVTVNC